MSFTSKRGFGAGKPPRGVEYGESDGDDICKEPLDTMTADKELDDELAGPMTTVLEDEL